MTPEQRAARRELARRELARREAARAAAEPAPEPMPEAPPTAEQMEAAGFGDLAETMRGFQQYEEPPGPVEQLGRAVVGRGSQFARSAVEAPIAWAAAETGPATEENLRSLLAEEGFDWDRWKAYVDEAATGTDARKSREAEFAKAFPITSGAGLSKPASLLAQAAIEPRLEAWREWEAEAYDPSEPDMYKALDALTKGNAAPFAQFLGEGIVGSVPGIAAALISSPLVVASYVNDIARSRAENNNRPIERGDIVAAVPAAVGIAGMEKVGIGSFSRGVGRGFVGEGVTEAAQETLQAATEEVGTEKGFDLAETLKSRTAPAAVVGGFTGGVAGIPSSALSRRRTPTDTTPTALPEAAPIVEEVVETVDAPAEVVDTPETIIPVVVGAEPGASRTFGPAYQRSELERAVDAAIDLEDGAADTRRRVAESERRVRSSVPTRPGVEAEPRRKTSFENQADSDQSMADAVRLAVSPDAPISEVAGAVARAVGGEAQAKAGIRDARAAKNEDTVAFLEELGNSPEQIAAIMAREPVSYAQARASLVDSGMLTSIQDGRVVVPGSVQTLANDVVFRGKLPDATETLALLHSMVMTKRAYKRAIANAAQIDPNDSGALEAANKDLSALLKDAEHYAKANTLGGSAVGRALRYRRFRVNEDMDLVDAITLATIRNKAPLSEDQRQVIKDIFTKADADIKTASAKRVRLFEKLKEARKDLRKAERDGVKKAIASAQRRVDDLEGGILEADTSIRAAKAEKEISPDVGSRSRARRRFVDPAMELADMSRALKSTLDDSALMRQGRELFFKSLFDLDNQAGLKTIGPALRMLTTGRRGRAYARRLQEGILKRDMQAASEYAGLELAEIEGAGDSHSFGVDPRTEKFQTNVFEKGPFRRWLGKHIVYPSQNAYSYTLNALRVWYFDKKVKEIARKIDPSLGPNPTAKQVMEVVPKTDLQFVANYINSSTGRGKWKLSDKMVKNADGSFDPITGAARTFLYAPRYTLSRFEHALKVPMLAALPAAKKMAPALAGVGPYGKLSDAARGSMAKAAYGELGFGLVLGALAEIAAATTSGDEPDDAFWDKFLNPGSADFGKIVIGDMHLDFTGGLGPTWRHVLAQIYTMDEGPRLFEFESRRLGQLIRNKMHPFWSQLYAIGTNEDYLGRPLTEAEWEWTLDDMDEKATYMLERFVLPAAGAFTPIMLESGYEHFAGEETGPLDGAELLKRAGGAAGEFLGTGVSRYVPDEGRYGAAGRRRRPWAQPRRDWSQ